MSPTEFLRELGLPFRSVGVALALATFFLLLSLIALAVDLIGLFAIAALWLAVVVMAALMRYLVLVAEARSLDVEVAPPGAEYFTLVGNLWTLFPAAVLLSAAFLAFELRGADLPLAATALVALVATLFPAMIGVLTLTHSALESLNPKALGRYILALGANYWYALAAAAPPAAVFLLIDELPTWLAIALALTSLASFFAVVGGLTRSNGLVEEVGIPLPTEPDSGATSAELERRRTAVLNHAYGFASRGNRRGALAHISTSLESDPDADSARAWYFEGMLTWEDSSAALVFAQAWLGRLLGRDDAVRAVKLMLRCRLINARFRPQPEDLELALAAARRCRNDELVEALERL